MNYYNDKKIKKVREQLEEYHKKIYLSKELKFGDNKLKDIRQVVRILEKYS